MIRVKTFTGESNLTQEEANHGATMAFNVYLNENPGVHFVTGNASVSTTHVNRVDLGDWHTCTIVAVMDLPDGSKWK